jgi:hypothetical protein
MAEFIVGGLFATALWLYRTPPPPKPKDDVNLTPPVFDRLPPVSERMMQSAMQHAFSIERRRRLFNDHFINDNDVRGRSAYYLHWVSFVCSPAHTAHTHTVPHPSKHSRFRACTLNHPSLAAEPLVLCRVF